MTFAQASKTEQLHRLGALAGRALAAFDLPDAGYKLAAYTNNAIYHVQHTNGDYALRLHRPELKRREWITAELEWLTALHQAETGLCVPHPARDLYDGELEGVEGPVYAALFYWIPGQPHPTLNIEQVRALGGFAARLHEQGFRPSQPRPRLDWEGLFGQDSPYYPGPTGEALFTSSQRDVIGAVTAKVGEAMAELDAEPNTFGLIHADMIAKNLLLRDDATLCVLDFDDCAYGYYLYEFAPLLLGYKNEPDYAERRQALWEGYTAVRALPARHLAHLETMIAARHVASCRWIAGNQNHPALRGQAGEIIAARVEAMHTYLKTGAL